MIGLRFEIRPQDCWVGVYWKVSWELLGPEWRLRTDDAASAGQLPRLAPRPTDAELTRRLDLWVCLLPCLPLHLWFLRPCQENDRADAA